MLGGFLPHQLPHLGPTGVNLGNGEARTSVRTQQLPLGSGPFLDDGCLHAGSLVFNGVISSGDLRLCDDKVAVVGEFEGLAARLAAALALGGTLCAPRREQLELLEPAQKFGG